MTVTARLALVTLLVTLTTTSVYARPASTAEYADVTGRYARERDFSGVVLVVRDGRTVYQGAFGKADPARGTPNTIDTRFSVASVNKLLMAVTTLRLQEQGRLRLDDPITRYLKDAPASLRAVRVRNLLNHTSGLPDPEQIERPPVQAYRSNLTLDQYVTKYLGAPRWTPGSRSMYNNFDYIVLSKVIEVASGQRWEDTLRDRVLTPAGMRDSGLFTDETVPARLARGQYRDGAGWTDDPPFRIRQYFGAGALYATAPDLARFDAALRAGRLIGAASLRDLLSADPTLGYVAPGNWVYPQTLDGRTVKVSERYGNVWGSFSILARGVDDANTVIVLSNRHDLRQNVENDLKADLLALAYRK
ncbi:serine hydrolase domain-containing protein [Deinococcus pimensis]|uniref:serine hydrolase domain-containing protein n=1 Tax=Deinococcus pimensis TaxID=309888 RepID=UPI00048971F0|nr:serine hydrolase domain-containing protein [Deinococcus pimensis]